MCTNRPQSGQSKNRLCLWNRNPIDTRAALAAHRGQGQWVGPS